MAGNTFGTLFKAHTFGESHGPAVGVVVDGVPPGLQLTEKDIQDQLDRRKPGQSTVTTRRCEPDTVQILSGVFNGITTGMPVLMLIYNREMRSDDYNNLKDIFRPGHADFTYYKKYGNRDYRGGGRASGRETVGRVAAGAIARKLLIQRGISVLAYTLRAAGVHCTSFNPDVIEKNSMRAPDMEAAWEMEKRISALEREGDSAGGIIECRIKGVDPGLGEPVFEKLDAELGKAMLSIGSVKGVEFGAGFAAADMKGSEHNDPLDSTGFLSNNAGGILGGISTGQEILFRLAVKPTASISRLQKTVDTTGQEREIIIEGRHDPCICPRIVPVVEAMACLVIEDLYKRQAALGQ
ncbi:MAG: chorismate synthase [Spirochaetota bacterium]